MHNQVNGLLDQWKSIRNNSLSFINELEEKELDAKLPRKGLNTIRKHFEEMIEVQQDYVTAIETAVMNFNGLSDMDIKGKKTKKQLIENMNSVDNKLTKILNNANKAEVILWFGDKKSLSYHLSALIAHEALHIGQIIAFCYVLDIKIPEYVTESWALSGK